MSEKTKEVTCAHAGCRCRFSVPAGSGPEEKLFCSEGCREGEGCGCEECSCG